MEIVSLNNNDNTGARYLLMAIYAYLEEEKEIKKQEDVKNITGYASIDKP